MNRGKGIVLLVMCLLMIQFPVYNRVVIGKQKYVILLSVALSAVLGGGARYLCYIFSFYFMFGIKGFEVEAILGSLPILGVLVCFIFLLIWSGKKGGIFTVLMNMLVFFVSFMLAINVLASIQAYLTNPSPKEQEQILSQLAEDIKRENLPYQVDVKPSGAMSSS